ncbi:MAG: VOC family protein [Rhodospirillaceae bacterium]|jgi:PhnB protein|nr:VOC family protein [Rhodospirillaceae bacterium]MBT5243264.1 VOC family protein [Rhodospirillaceae bacterium]MBT5563952.1 VOC family protein [Rhodospirillaceae bacterium]MBT6240844.1 VOC family protein [Rhodospirillaceae bacterium]
MIDEQNIPSGYHSITPYFTVRDADRLLEFLTTAFKATIIKETRYDNKKIQHARVRIGNSILMLNESTDTYPVNVSQMHLYVEDADETYTAALQCGATTLMEPNDRPHGDRMAGVEDPCGNIWWIATSRR